MKKETPFDSMDKLLNTISELQTGYSTTEHESVPIDVQQTDAGIDIIVELTGYDAEDVRLSVSDDNVLTLEATATVEDVSNNGILIEQRSFSRTIRLPDYAVMDSADATVKNDILTITFETVPEEQAENIDIHTN